MLVPIQTSGHKPPLFFVHGRPGIMPVGPALSRVLGPDQPLYVFHASGIDGRGPVIDNVPEMVRTPARRRVSNASERVSRSPTDTSGGAQQGFEGKLRPPQL